jgi:hypothetical protein
MADAQAKPQGDDELAEGEGAEDTVGLDLEAIADELAAAEGFVDERVKHALAPYRGMFPPEVIAEYEDDLRCFLLTHPVASQMLARVRPRAQRSSSGEEAIMGMEIPGNAALRARKNGAG